MPWSIHNILLWLPNLQYKFPNSRLTFWNCLVDTLCHLEVGFYTEQYNVILIDQKNVSRSMNNTSKISEQHYVQKLLFPVLMIKNSGFILMSFFLYCSEYCMLSRKKYSSLDNHLLKLKLINIYIDFSAKISLIHRSSSRIYLLMNSNLCVSHNGFQWIT